LRYLESRGNVFTLGKDYYLAHCISSDLEMSAGIAVPMKKKFRLSKGISNTGESTKHPTCILCNGVFNLITKKHYYGKPTYNSIEKSLLVMRDIAVSEGVKFIGMPKVGCGRDKLQWGRVRETLRGIFEDTDITLRVCYI